MDRISRRAARRAARASRRGVVLFVVLATLVAIGLLAGTVFLVSAADLRMVGRHKSAAEALHAADAGAQYVKTRIAGALAANGLALTGAVIAVSYAAPTGMAFETVRELWQIGNSSSYWYRVTGLAPGSRAMVDVAFRRSSIFEMGLFGDTSLEAKTAGGVYVYDSRDVAYPTPSDSIGGAFVASNGRIWTHQDTYIDGSFGLGESSAYVDGEWVETPSGGTTVRGETSVSLDRIDPDPLGALSGDLAAQFAYYSVAANNDNASADPPIASPQNRISLGNGETMVLPAGSYYVSSISVRNGASLVIDDAAGPVSIYLTGGLSAGEGSQINFTGSPASLTIFSNSDDPITLRNEGAFKGIIYAPYASVDIMNDGDFYGICWAADVELKNSGNFYIDVAAMERFPADAIEILSWKDVRL